MERTDDIGEIGRIGGANPILESRVNALVLQVLESRDVKADHDSVGRREVALYFAVLCASEDDRRTELEEVVDKDRMIQRVRSSGREASSGVCHLGMQGQTAIVNSTAGRTPNTRNN